MTVIVRRRKTMVKKIPEGKKGAGLRALKKKAPQIAKRMGYKHGGMNHEQISGWGDVRPEVKKFGK